MTRTFFAIAIAAVMLGAVPMTAGAAPIAPLTGVALGHDNLTQSARFAAAQHVHNVCNTPTRSNPKPHTM